MNYNGFKFFKKEERELKETRGKKGMLFMDKEHRNKSNKM